MIRALLFLAAAAPLLLAAPPLYAATPHQEPDIPDFTDSADRFADAAACRDRIILVTVAARAAGFDAVEGPYDFGAGDVRMHTVTAEGGGHRIHEYRCLAEKLGERSWTHAISPLREEEFTVESVARRAPWLQNGGRQ
jgi:hypothetical protein